MAQTTFLPSSDLNIEVWFSGKTKMPHAQFIDGIRGFHEYLLEYAGCINKSDTRFFESNAKLSLELNRNNYHQRVEIVFYKIYNPSLISNEYMLTSFSQQYPMLIPIYLTLRRLLDQSHLCNGNTQGLLPLHVYLMIVAFLQNIGNGLNTYELLNTSCYSNYKSMAMITVSSQVSRSVSMKSVTYPNDQTNAINDGEDTDPIVLAELFLNMIYFYGYSFDFETFAIKPFLPGDPVRSSFVMAS